MKLLLPIAIVFAGAFAAGEATAQQICTIIAPYFAAAPTKFISERGERLDLDTWTMKQDIPGFDCELSFDINLDLQKTYGVSCRVNVGADRTVITGYHEAMTRDLQTCVNRLPNGNRWKKESGREAGTVYEYTYVEWDIANPSDKSHISLRAVRHKRTGKEFNSISWSHRCN
jgi:hypothetical protein